MKKNIIIITAMKAEARYIQKGINFSATVICCGFGKKIIKGVRKHNFSKNDIIINCGIAGGGDVSLSTGSIVIPDIIFNEKDLKKHVLNNQKISGGEKKPPLSKKTTAAMPDKDICLGVLVTVSTVAGKEKKIELEKGSILLAEHKGDVNYFVQDLFLSVLVHLYVHKNLSQGYKSKVVLLR